MGRIHHTPPPDYAAFSVDRTGALTNAIKTVYRQKHYNAFASTR